MQHNYYGTKPCMTEFSYAQGLHGACCRVKKVQYFQTNTTHLETCTKKYMNLNSVTEQNDAYSGCLEADTDHDGDKGEGLEGRICFRVYSSLNLSLHNHV